MKKIKGNIQARYYVILQLIIYFMKFLQKLRIMCHFTCEMQRKFEKLGVRSSTSESYERELTPAR
jgi:hypothetical protein